MKNKGIGQILFLAAWLGLFPAMQAENVVTLSSSSGTPNEEVQVDVSLAHTDAVSSMQVSIPLKGMVGFVENSCTLSTGNGSHVISGGVRKDTLNIFVYSALMKNLQTGKGAVFSFKLKLGREPLTFALEPSKLILTDSTGTQIVGKSVSGAVTTLCAKAVCSTDSIGYGREPLRSTYTNTNLTISNVGNIDLVISALTFSDARFAAASSLPLTIAAGGSSAIAVKYAPTVRGFDATTLEITSNAVNRLKPVKYTAQPFAVNELHIPNISGISDSIVTVALNVNNMDDLNGFQFEFNLTPMLKYVAGSFKLSTRATNQVITEKVANDTLRLMSYSPTGSCFKGNEGEIATFQVKLNGQYGCNLEPYKTILSADLDGVPTNVTSDVYGTWVNIQSPNLSCSNQVDLGATSITETTAYSYQIQNQGSSDLVIDRIVFDTLGFSVKETLPIVIKPWQSGAFTVLYNGEKAAAFHSLMQIYNNTPSNRVYNVKVSGKRFEPNYLALTAASAMKSDTLAITAEMSNYTPIDGFQFDLTYPAKYYESYSGNIVKASRIGNLDVQYSQLNDSTLRIIGYSLTGAEMAKGSGALFTIKFKPKEQIVDSTYVFTARHINLGSAALTNMYSGPTEVKVGAVVFTYAMGDVDHNGLISISDAVAIINHIVGSPNKIFIFNAADMDINKIITINDAVLLVKYIVGGVKSAGASMMSKSSANIIPNLEIMPFSIKPGEEKTLEVLLNHADYQETAFQFDMTMPEGITIESCEKVEEGLSASHCMYTNMPSSNVLKVACLSLSNATITETNGPVAKIRIKADDNMAAGDYDFALKNVRIAHSSGFDEVVNADQQMKMTVMTTTGIQETTSNNLRILVGKGTIMTQCVNSQKVVIINLSGQVLANYNLRAGETRTITVVPGIYFVNKEKIRVQ